VHVDTEQSNEKLINARLAYVSVSRGRYDAQIYTNDAGKLGEELSREVSKQSALEADRSGDRDLGYSKENSHGEEVSQTTQEQNKQVQEHGLER
jgi:hypothetical protein